MEKEQITLKRIKYHQRKLKNIQVRSWGPGACCVIINQYY